MEFIINNWIVSLLTVVIVFATVSYVKTSLLSNSILRKKSLSTITKVSELKEWFALHKRKVSLDNIDASNKETRLTQAIKANDAKFAMALIDLGASTSSLNGDGQNPMHVAIGDDNKKLRKLLFKSGYDIEATNSDGYTSLHWAVMSNNMDAIKECLAKKSSLNTANLSGDSLVHTATFKQNSKIISLLISKGANAELTNDSGQRPIHISSTQEDPEITEILIQNGVTLDTTDGFGFYPLMVATDHNNVAVMELLIERGANVEKSNKEGDTSLIIAIKKSHTEATSTLLQAKADVNAKTDKGETPLLLLTKISKDINMMNILIENNADLGILDTEGNSALMNSVSTDKELFVDALITAQAPLENDEKLINFALRNKNPNILKTLIAYDAKSTEDNIVTAITIDTPYQLISAIIAPHRNNLRFLQSMLERAIRNNKQIAVDLFSRMVNVDDSDSVSIAASLGPQRILDLVLAQSTNPIFTKLINVLHIDNNETTTKLTFKDLIQSDVGGEIIYTTPDKNFRIAPFEFDVERELGLDRVVLEDNRSGTHSVHFYNSTSLGKLVRDLKINDRNVVFLKTESVGISKYIFIEHIDGSTLGNWHDKQGYIEDVLKMPVEIEMYDKTHELYGRYGKTKMILIKESNLSSIPSICNLSGVFVKESDNAGSSEIHFSGITNKEEWKKSESRISKLLNKKITVDVQPDPQIKYQYKVILRVSIEYSIPDLLDWDDNKELPKLLYVKKDTGVNTYFYSYSHNKDITAWKEASRKTNFKTLFDQPDRVYILETYNRENSKLWNKYSHEFEEKNLIALHEYDAIPSKGDLMKFDPSSELRLNEVLWGYGAAASRYYTKINDMAHMMIIGGTGSGKSNFINGIILSLLRNIKQIQKMYLIDLKSGIEFNRYKDINPNKVDVFSRGTSPTKLLEALKEVEAEMCLREQYMSDVGIVQYPDNPIFIIIDEYAQIELMPGKGAEMRAKDDILDLLVRIGTKARSANIKLIVQTQNPRAVQEELKSNLMSRVLLKTSKSADLSLTIQDEDMAYDLGLKHISFDKGRFIFEDYNDGDTIMTELQFPFIDVDKKYHEKYASTGSQKVDSKLDKYKQSVASDYPYLAQTKVLSGSGSGIEPEPEMSSKPEPRVAFDFNAMLKPNPKKTPGEKDLDNILDDIDDLAIMDSQASDILNELLGED